MHASDTFYYCMHTLCNVQFPADGVLALADTPGGATTTIAAGRRTEGFDLVLSPTSPSYPQLSASASASLSVLVAGGNKASTSLPSEEVSLASALANNAATRSIPSDRGECLVPPRHVTKRKQTQAYTSGRKRALEKVTQSWKMSGFETAITPSMVKTT